ncbi:FAD-binding and (Fe-S)-binding domain-containing protein [Glaciimonas sp. Gout2]|uniref:D-2-hydroxyglutarate dehydrogenase YdiJ n=3 Tax=Glaciimonas TaxID=1229970 RepID=UPI002AB3C485|nr:MULTISPECIES: FAD-binding and (Fe-S)-binding domain-containing protein [unclassified Glaciimonas]MDY7548920.1 FAD-binding and (Fe-S)-binding domain-containing protein [Glaciimonas sp. CA11.2]MEB0013618.1 FAD-binding and (Fe-S)-binding domain-containing protein [Glaciimonas sp. Cout2]MEB0083644.1 FAD-binding and (Fe-S)-binding domain-containing protein [Glaciimonas sp. Gout2]
MIPRLLESLPVESIYLDFISELQVRGFEGEVSARFADRTVFSTDNSIYQRLPNLVVFPKTVDDVVRITSSSADPRFSALALTPRGGGTGTNGQALSDGIVVDISRNMNRILEINVAERWVRVEAGVVKDQLNAALKPHGLFFAPELSTSNRATIGGMISTDASGQGSCLYGKTRNHVLELSTVLLDGTLWHSRALRPTELEILKCRTDRVGAIHRVIDAIYRNKKDLIASIFPKLNRCLTGYDLAHIRDENGLFNLNNILCGSEGTLGMVVEAKLNVLPIPRCSALVNIRYKTFDNALRDAPNLMALSASSIETIDSKVLGLARQDVIWLGVKDFFPEDEVPAMGINLVEFLADSVEELNVILNRVEAYFQDDTRSTGRCGFTMAKDNASVERIWGMRKKAVGLLGNTKGEKRPIPFVEDTVVPPEHLADYIAEFRALLDSHKVDYGMFGHVDAGVLHVRPFIDMKDLQQEKLIRLISEEVVVLTKKYKGLLWGEHGKGIRSEFSPDFFGPLYACLQEIKAVFDPENRLNPGKIVAPDDARLLRIDSVPTRGQLDRVVPPHVRAAFTEALHCNGNGACFNYNQDDAMCPSWKATRDRRHSPKGRASLLREWLRQLAMHGVDPLAETARLRKESVIAKLPIRLTNSVTKRFGRYDFSNEVFEAMDGCLACKSCAGQCPVKVDVPEFRAKFLELYYSRYLRSPKDYLIASLESMLPAVSKISTLYNALIGSRVGRKVLRVFNLVETPVLTGIDLQTELRRRGFSNAISSDLNQLSPLEKSKSVIVVQDAFTSYFETRLVLDLFELLRELGFTPFLAPYAENGKPLHVNGFLKRFQRVAARTADKLVQLEKSGINLVGIDPSMTLAYRAEYVKVLGENAGPSVQLVQEWLADHVADLRRVPATRSPDFFLLPHCSEKTNVPSAITDWQKVFEALGLRLEIKASGCCGMAGTYGHEAKKRSISETIYGQSWGPIVRAQKKDEVLLATGYSCRCQAKLIDGIEIQHPVTALLTFFSAR